MRPTPRKIRQAPAGARARAATPGMRWLLLAGAAAGLLIGAGTGDAGGAQTAAPPVPAGWLHDVSREIRRLEYRFSDRGDGSWSAPNRAQGLRTTIRESGLEVVSRTRGAEAFRLTLRLTGFGREGVLSPPGSAGIVHDGERIELRYARLTEWYVNERRGLEQAFTLPAPPEGAAVGPVVLEMALGGAGPRAKLSEDARSVTFAFALGSGTLLRYAGLAVVDAAGEPVPARLHAAPGRLQIRIDDGGAVYPLTVDPLIGQFGWGDVGTAGDVLGESVATAGDVNGDGFSDVIVSVRGYDNGEVNEGAAFLYLGSASSLSSTPDWMAESNQGQFLMSPDFGVSVATAGDVNGDGFDDVIIGASKFTNTVSEEGAAFLWLGGAGGMGPDGNPGNADWSYFPGQQESFFGFSVATAGDVDGDGDDDVIIGAPKASNGEMNEGRAFLFVGVPGGLAVAPAWTAESNQACTPAGSICPGPWFGGSVAGAGDVNGDGFDDIVIGARSWEDAGFLAGAAFVWHGSASFGTNPDGTPANATWFAEGNGLAGSFGGSVATAGDVNGDGFADVIIGSTVYSNGQQDEGGAFVYHGGAAGLGPIGSPANADWHAEGDEEFARLGSSVATAGDINGDGFADVIVGAPFHATNQGRAYVWLGGAGGLGADGTPANADGTTGGAFPGGSQTGKSVATAGDVNGDGYSDVIVGSPAFEDTGSQQGAAAVYLGEGDGPLETASWDFDGDDGGAALGMSVASAGDTNGDGYSEVIVGAPRFDGGEVAEGKVFVFIGSSGGLFLTPSWTAESDQRGAELGHAVASAGDMNGDGFSDVVAGAPLYEKTLTDSGWVFAWHGGPAGIGDDAGLGANGTPANADWGQGGDQAGGQLGFSVAPAGDVNGDGIGDLLLGAPFYDAPEADEGRAYLFAGSAGGAPSLIWTAEADQAGAELGTSVGTAGDVDADGFGDVILGAPGFSNPEAGEGAAVVWMGGGAGMGAGGTPGNAAWMAESDQAGARLGESVGTAGDVLGNGFSDVMVGAPGFADGEAGEGAVFVWYAFPAGLGADGTPANAWWMAEGDVADAELGASVSSGDLNGDGLGDVLIGAPGFGNVQAGEGIALAWFGSSFGLNFGFAGSPAGADWKVESNQVGARLGASVAFAGDVNGDGFGDIIAGAPDYDFPEVDEGRAFVYYGGGGDGLHRIPRQGNPVGLGPLHALGKSDGDTSFRLRVLARSPGGRANVRLLWEVKPLGTPFDGTGQVLSPLQMDTGSPDFFDGSAVEFDELMPGLAPGTFYRWRARILTDSPLFPRSPWLTIPYNTRNETDLRTSGCLDDDGDGYGRAVDPLCPADPILDCDDGEATVFPGNPESCDNLDNNCDGTVDEGNPGGGAFCDTGRPGVCADGTITCLGGGLQCREEVSASLEICDNLDNDCNGFADNFGTSCGVGQCAATGSCVGGVDSCVPGMPAAEVCDGVDNDCDGELPLDEFDGDGDGALACADCDDGAPGVIAIPGPLTGLVVARQNPNLWRWQWDSQAMQAGVDTVYDVFSGLIPDIDPVAGFSGGSCVGEDLTIPRFIDLSPDPAPGVAVYFLFRGQNGCGDGTFGSAFRDSTAAASPTACL
ncbi:MAG: FG-GAP-like repeat-containing protein [Acidobacteriota bacterium]